MPGGMTWMTPCGSDQPLHEHHPGAIDLARIAAEATPAGRVMNRGRREFIDDGFLGGLATKADPAGLHMTLAGSGISCDLMPRSQG